MLVGEKYDDLLRKVCEYKEEEVEKWEKEEIFSVPRGKKINNFAKYSPMPCNRKKGVRRFLASLLVAPTREV